MNKPSLHFLTIIHGHRVITGTVLSLLTVGLIAAVFASPLLADPPALQTGKTALPSVIYMPGFGSPNEASVTLTVTAVGDTQMLLFPLDIMLLIDKSTSMEGPSMDSAKAAAAHFCSLLDDTLDQSGLVSFNWWVTMDQALTTNHQLTIDAIMALTTGSGTAIGSAINRAQTELLSPRHRPQSKPIMILLSDGDNNAGPDPVAAAAAAKAQGTFIYAISLGTTLDTLTMKAIASDPDSVYYFHAPTFNALDSVYQKIHASFSVQAARNISANEILAGGFEYVPGSFSIAPVALWGDTAIWDLGNMDIGNAWTVSFNIAPNDTGHQVPVDDYPSARVDYTNYLGNPESVSFPQAYLDVMGPSIVGLQVEPDQSSQVPPLGSHFYILQATLDGNTSDVVDMSAGGTKPGWQVLLFEPDSVTPLYDSDGDSTPDLGAIFPDSATEFVVKVTAPDIGMQEQVDSTFIYGQSSGAPAIRDSALLVTTAVPNPAVGLEVEPDQSSLIPARSSHFYVIQTMLKGGSQEVVDIATSGTRPEWQVELFETDSVTMLGDSDGDGIPDLGTSKPDTLKEFLVKVTAPEITTLGDVDTTINVDRTLVYGHCSLIPTVADSAILVTTAYPVFDVHNYASPFRETTHIIFSLPQDGRVTLVIYNRIGEKIRTLLSGDWLGLGVHIVPWDGRNDIGSKVSPGTYVYQFGFRGSKGYKADVTRKTAIIP
jgi:uncharacterized protein YegL